LDARIAKLSPIAPPCFAESAEPIVDEFYFDPGPCFFDQCVGKYFALAVVMDDIAFEIDAFLCRGDRGKPCGVVFGGVDQKADIVAADQRSIRYALENTADEFGAYAGFGFRHYRYGSGFGLYRRHAKNLVNDMQRQCLFAGDQKFGRVDLLFKNERFDRRLDAAGVSPAAERREYGRWKVGQFVRTDYRTL